MIGRPAPTSHTKSPSTRTACKARLHGTSGQGQRRGSDRRGRVHRWARGAGGARARLPRAGVRPQRRRRRAGRLPQGDEPVRLRSPDAPRRRPRRARLLRRDLPRLRRRRPRLARQHLRRSRVRAPHVRPHHRQRRSVGVGAPGRRDVEPRGDHLRGRHHRARAPPDRRRGPRTRRVEPEAHTRARAGLLDGQGHRPARVRRRRRGERSVGCDHGVPGRQRRARSCRPTTRTAGRGST